MRLKKVKNAKELVEASPYFVKQPEEHRGNWKTFFNNKNDIHIEIGMGKGNFILQMALLYPEVNFIGIEKYDSVLVKSVKSLEKIEFLPNLKLILMDAENIEEVFQKEIARIYLNFSDPWPKKKHEKRRLTSHEFLRRYDGIFEGKKDIIQKTDNKDFFDFSCESLESFGYHLDEIIDDLYALNDLQNVPTEYEEKFRNKGVNIHRLKAHKD